MLAGKQLPCPSKAALHFVGDEQDAVFVAEFDEYSEIIEWRNDKSSFSQNRFSDDGSNIFRRHDALERVFQVTGAVEIAGGIFQRVGAAIAIRVRHAVDVTGERRKSRFVRMRLAGERQSHHSAPVEGVFESDDGG